MITKVKKKVWTVISILMLIGFLNISTKALYFTGGFYSASNIR